MCELEQKKLKTINGKTWSCTDCDIIPFKDINNLDMTKNINYNSLNDFSCHKNILEVSTSFGDLKGLPELQLDFSQNVGDNKDAPVLDFDYYTLQEFRRLVKNMQDDKCSLSILHTNIRYPTKKIFLFFMLNNICYGSEDIFTSQCTYINVYSQLIYSLYMELARKY
ncbi:uncharacterized protein LOC130630511 [Hydractinia symbiolongicarpus]|uniref:uncharacterized protein LOC130630511 n=1 Tax=Hydractinia symbiolongicarpus TaxID=13093 RepID=UPI00254B2343|nr:uncharacterized protein LOC130630511 [Hydractinia symbiolongicarpus]